jgi:voltage-dependent anion channel protein 2
VAKLLNKDFYHTAAGKANLSTDASSCMGLLIRSIATLEVKTKAPNGVSFNVKGKSAHETVPSGQVSKLAILRSFSASPE